MNKLQALTQFIIELDLVAVENIDTWMEEPRIKPIGRQETANCILLFQNEYDAVFSIERFPHKRHSPNVLFGNICTWLMTEDCERDENAQPRTDVDILDDDVADVEITISFTEDVYAIKDVNGDILYNGEQYRLADAAEIDIAEDGSVTT